MKQLFIVLAFLGFSLEGVSRNFFFEVGGSYDLNIDVAKSPPKGSFSEEIANHALPKKRLDVGVVMAPFDNKRLSFLGGVFFGQVKEGEIEDDPVLDVDIIAALPKDDLWDGDDFYVSGLESKVYGFRVGASYDFYKTSRMTLFVEPVLEHFLANSRLSIVEEDLVWDADGNVSTKLSGSSFLLGGGVKLDVFDFSSVVLRIQAVVYGRNDLNRTGGSFFTYLHNDYYESAWENVGRPLLTSSLHLRF